MLTINVLEVHICCWKNVKTEGAKLKMCIDGSKLLDNVIYALCHVGRTPDSPFAWSLSIHSAYPDPSVTGHEKRVPGLRPWAPPITTARITKALQSRLFTSNLVLTCMLLPQWKKEATLHKSCANSPSVNLCSLCNFFPPLLSL